ncbi:MAG TPA: hypothetical protein PK095_03765, partial [Myxococcota bacterium]|nr:hypothetical protein [Myxococcota bacterium]
LANTDCCSGLCSANVCVGPALPNVVAGNLTIDGPGTLPPDYECITEVTGTLQIAPNPINGALPPLNFASLQLVGGGFVIVGTSTIASAHFPLLTDIGAGFTHYGTEPLLLSLPALDTVGSYLFFYGDELTLALPSLSSLAVPITIAPLAPAGALDLSFSALAAGESVFVYGVTASSSIAFPALTSLTGSVVAGYTDADPDALSFPSLTTLGGDLQVAGSASNSPGGTLWSDLSTFASVQSVDRLIVRNNTSMTGLGLTSLTSVSDSVIIRWNTALDCALAQALLGQLGGLPPTATVDGNLAGCSLP